jgi:alkylhydroperoxidase/carboxymuconolactone decarboxylase family protein YurZ
MFEDRETVRRTRKQYNGKMLTSGVDIFRKMATLEEEALKSGALDQRFKELMALGISISKACYG